MEIELEFDTLGLRNTRAYVDVCAGKLKLKKRKAHSDAGEFTTISTVALITKHHNSFFFTRDTSNAIMAFW